MTKKRKDSGPAFTILVGAVAAIIFAFVFASIPHNSAPKPAATPVSFKDVQLAGSLYTLDLQAIQLAEVATKNSGNPTLNRVGGSWNKYFVGDKALLAKWLEKNHAEVTDDGQGMSHSLSLPKPLISQLIGSNDAHIAETMLGLRSLFNSANPANGVIDPTLKTIIASTTALFEGDYASLSVVSSGH